MQAVEHHDAELVHDLLRNIQPMELGMEESRQASVELVGTADHTGCGVQHSLQFVGRRLRRTRQDRQRCSSQCATRRTNVRVWPPIPQLVNYMYVFYRLKDVIYWSKVCVFSPFLLIQSHSKSSQAVFPVTYGTKFGIGYPKVTRGQSNLTKRASRGANSPVRGHPRGSKFVPLNSWGRVSY